MAVFADLLKELEYALLQIVQAAQMTQQMKPLEESELNRLMTVDIQRCTQDISKEAVSRHGTTEAMIQKFVQTNGADQDVANQLQR